MKVTVGFKVEKYFDDETGCFCDGWYDVRLQVNGVNVNGYFCSRERLQTMKLDCLRSAVIRTNKFQGEQEKQTGIPADRLLKAYDDAICDMIYQY
jgi:hypothetical protein